jgi:hypothetical protein
MNSISLMHLPEIEPWSLGRPALSLVTALTELPKLIWAHTKHVSEINFEGCYRCVWLVWCNCVKAQRKGPKSPCQILIWLLVVSRNGRENWQTPPLGKRGDSCKRLDTGKVCQRSNSADSGTRSYLISFNILSKQVSINNRSHSNNKMANGVFHDLVHQRGSPL